MTLKKEIEIIKDGIVRDIRILFKQEKEDYYKPVKVDNFCTQYYIEYGSNADRNKALLIKDYFIKLRPHSKDVMNNLKKSYTWKIQSTIAITFLSSEDTDKGRVMMSEREIGYQIDVKLETSMKRGDFVADFVHLLYYKCH